MKSTVPIILLLTVFVSSSCRHDKEKLTKDFTGNRLALLQVDYETFAFEGGVEYHFDVDSEGFTIRGEYQGPGDFGWVKLYFDELDTLIFYGSIVWNGKGERNYPDSLIDAADFELADVIAPMPPEELFNGEFDGVPTTEFTEIEKNNIWEAINNLELVVGYRGMNPSSKVQIYCYRPSVGVGDPADWDWLVFLKN